jgi:hypothetical protein
MTSGGTGMLTLAALAIWGAAATAQPAAGRQTDGEWAPFVIDHFSRQDGPADVRFLLDGPAGKYGQIEARDGHLYLPNGKRFRCWGVNLTGWTVGGAEIPPKQEGSTFARQLARLGVNCVRFHFLDMPDTSEARQETGPTGDAGPTTNRPRGLIDSKRDDTSHFNPQQLDRLDHFFAELKANGIYANFNLNVGHTWKKGDNVPDAELIGVAKAYTHFGPELIAKQKEYARMLLGHTNPYTKMRYADDPAVVTVEILNENSLLEFWQRNWFRGELKDGAPRRQLDLTPHYLDLLTRLYNEWLARNRSAAEIAAIRREAGVAASSPIPIMRTPQFPHASKTRFHAEAQFLIDTERGFFKDMEGFLRNELGVKAPIIATADHTYFIPGEPHLASTSALDIVDAHVYWQHPAIYGKRNTPMVNEPLDSIIQKLSRTAMVGKPFTVSEVNEPFPNEYDAELIPILAAYGALQDWDGIYFYTFEAQIRGQQKQIVGDHFDITQHPSKIAQLPVGAMMFLRGDVAAAKKVVTRSYSAEQIYEMARMPISAMPSFTPNYPKALPLVHETRIKCLKCAPTAPAAPEVKDPGNIVSDTGELSWRTEGGSNGLVMVDTPKSQALVGFIEANQVPTSQLATQVGTANLTADIGNDFAALTLSSLDGKPISESNLMLLTTSARGKNTGSEWNARRSVYSKWGEPPSLIDPVRGWIQLRDLRGPVGVEATALDGAARPIGTIKGRLIETGWEIPIGSIPTTSYLIRVNR